MAEPVGPSEGAPEVPLSFTALDTSAIVATLAGIELVVPGTSG